MTIRFKNTIGKIPIYLILIILAIVWIFPILATLLVGLKSPNDFLTSTFFQLPKKFYLFQNLQDMSHSYRLYKNFFNSLVYSVSGAAICVLLSSMAAFGVTKMKPPFAFFLFLVIYSGTIFPFQMYLIPLFVMYSSLGIYDTKFGMILFYMTICTPFATFLYRGFFLSITDDIKEAALIDGCSPVRLFLQIFVPQLMAPTAVVVLFQAMWIWNDLLFGMVLSATEVARPIMVTIVQISGTTGGNIPIMMSGVILVSIPTIALFLGLRKYFIKGYVLRAIR